MNGKRGGWLLIDVEAFGVEARARAAEYLRMAEEECPNGGFLWGDLGQSDPRLLVILNPVFGPSVRWFI